MGRKKKERPVLTKAEHDAMVKVSEARHEIEKAEKAMAFYSDGRVFNRFEVVTEIKGFMKGAITGVIEAGKRLFWAKQEIPHGEWKKFVEEEIGLPIRTATGWILIARRAANRPSSALLAQKRPMLLAELNEEELNEIEESGKLYGKDSDEIDLMPIRELREFRRKHRDTDEGWHKKVEREKKTAEEWKRIAAEKDQQMIDLKLGFSGEEQTALAQMQNAKMDFLHLYNRLNDADLSEASDKILAEYINLLYYMEDIVKLLAFSKDREFNRTDEHLDGAVNYQERLVWEKHPEFFDGKEPEVVKINRLQKEKFDKDQAEMAALTKKYGSSNLESKRAGGGGKEN